jgi:hypothetical protein
MERLVLCPGSWELTQQVEDAEIPTRSALEGTLIHEVLAGFRSEEGLTDRQAWVVKRSREIVVELERQLGFDGPDEERKVLVEDRIWYYDEANAELFSGQLDYAVVSSKRGLIVDYKTGSGPVTATSANYQMRASAVLLAHNYELEEVFVAIVQPLTDTPTSVVRYDSGELRRAEIDVLVALQIAMMAGARRVPGEKQCRYCRAKAQCPEARTVVEELAQLGATPIAPVAATGATAVSSLTDAELAALLPKLELAEGVIRELRQAARRRMEDNPGAFPGYRLRGGYDRRFVIDAARAYERLADVLTPEQFAACCTLQLGRTEETIARVNGETNAAARQILELLLGDLIQRRAAERGIEKVG